MRRKVNGDDGEEDQTEEQIKDCNEKFGGYEKVEVGKSGTLTVIPIDLTGEVEVNNTAEF